MYAWTELLFAYDVADEATQHAVLDYRDEGSIQALLSDIWKTMRIGYILPGRISVVRK